MTSSTATHSILLGRPWWQHKAQELKAASARFFSTRRIRRTREAELERMLFELDGMSPAMLKDIGAPDSVIERMGRKHFSAINSAYWG